MSENESKNKKLGYWVTTGLVCLVMTGGGVSDLLQVENLKLVMETLGYPLYLMTLLGMLKLMGVITILAPGFPRLKEWAYAGFTFDLSGATFSHLMVQDPVKDVVVPMVILAIVLTSWYLRPDSRRLASAAPVATAE